MASRAEVRSAGETLGAMPTCSNQRTPTQTPKKKKKQPHAVRYTREAKGGPATIISRKPESRRCRIERQYIVCCARCRGCLLRVDTLGARQGGGNLFCHSVRSSSALQWAVDPLPQTCCPDPDGHGDHVQIKLPLWALKGPVTSVRPANKGIRHNFYRQNFAHQELFLHFERKITKTHFCVCGANPPLVLFV